jgi:peroxiredoxin
MLELGTPAPDFALPDARTGETVSLADLAGEQALLVMFICNHCPFVQHVRHELAAIGRDYAGAGLAIVAINSNDARSHPEDAPPHMKAEAERQGYTFPYLFDESQSVARAYRAACTPDFYLFDSKRDRLRPARRHRRGAGRARAACGPEAVAGLQHQVAPGQRAAVRLTPPRGLPVWEGARILRPCWATNRCAKP